MTAARASRPSKPQVETKATPPRLKVVPPPAARRRAAPASTPARRATTAAPTKKAPAVHQAPKQGAQTDLEKQVYGMAIEHVQCRDFGHSWRPFSARWQPTYNVFEQILMCARCQTTRTRHLSSRGAQLDTKYDYTDGYQVKGMGRLTGTDRDIIRLASVRSVLEIDTVQE